MAIVPDESGNSPAGSGPDRKGSESAVLAINLDEAQSVAYTGSAGTISNPINAEMARVVATTDCFIANGSSPTATTSDTYLPAGVVEVIKITYGDKVSAVQSTLGGTLHVAEIT